MIHKPIKHFHVEWSIFSSVFGPGTRGSRGVIWRGRGWGRDLWYNFSQVEDETRRGIFPFSSAFSRTRRGIPRNFGLFLSHFKDETFDPCFSRSRTRRGEEFCLIPRPFRGRDETLQNLCESSHLGLDILFYLTSSSPTGIVSKFQGQAGPDTFRPFRRRLKIWNSVFEVPSNSGIWHG